MGTKFQYALNPFSISTSNNNSFPESQIADWRFTQEFGVREPLERRSTTEKMHHSAEEILSLQSQKIESIKKTMLMHEDIFQLQVRELHRLYDRQMKLMRELKNQMAHTCTPLGAKDANISQLSSWQKQMQEIRSNLPGYGSTHDSGERSASCSGESQRMPIGFNLEKVDEECPSEQERPNSNSHRPSPTIQIINSEESDEEIDVELTLSIGGSSSNSKSRKIPSNERKPCSLELEGLGSSFRRRQFSSSSALMERGTKEDFGEPSPALSSSSATQKQDKATSNWLLQGLSLNRT